jgi:hypothetical protein
VFLRDFATIPLWGVDLGPCLIGLRNIPLWGVNLGPCVDGFLGS